MPTQKNDRPVSSTQNSDKKRYKTPELKNFGQIAELTAAGSFRMNEMGMFLMRRRMP